MRHFSFIVIFLTMGACSFKRNPEKPAADVVVVEKSDKLTQDSESMLQKMSEDEFIALLDDKTTDYIQGIKNVKNETLIDVTVRLRKRKVLGYILGRGMSPFLFTSETNNLLLNDESVREQLQSFQRPIINHTAEELGKLLQTSMLDERLTSLNFNRNACYALLQLVVRLRYEMSVSELIPGDLYDKPVASGYDSAQAFRAILQAKTCKGLSDTLPSSEISSWAADELVYQRFIKFKSSDFLEYLFSLGEVENLVLTGYENGGKLRIDPLLILSYSGNPDEEVSDERAKQLEQEYQRWINIIDKHRSKDPYFYNLNQGSIKADERVQAIFDKEMEYYIKADQGDPEAN
ncbi:hypothetical protein [Bdellovibrio sp. NC01]|uniref:hypothetical protein n=1 Tax=Bdellovibrio sp. NC01 TaxID=2220073 RepID=UPI00115AEB04|nr:hypothetical protein [Bdellovibrio sp. NC01]